MKNIYFLLSFTLMFISWNEISAQNYHEDDKEGLRIFLRQQSSNSRVKNFELAGLTQNDTVNWYSSELWMEKFHSKSNYLYSEWNTQSPKRLITLYFLKTSTYRDKMSGDLNCEKFKELVTLSGYSNKLKSLDVSKNLKLEQLFCSYNELEELDLSHNTQLKELIVEGNYLNVIDVSHSINLESVTCSNNRLSHLDLPRNSRLIYLNCFNNQLTALDISHNKQLKELHCFNNQITEIDISNNILLEFFYCNDNQLKILDISNNINLSVLYCSNNFIEQIDASNNPKLTSLDCSENSLNYLVLPSVEYFSWLSIFNNNLTFSTIHNYTDVPKMQIVMASQHPMDGGRIGADMIIDISSEYDVNGLITSYQWYDENEHPIQLQELGEGKFIAGNKYAGQKLHCKLMNDYIEYLEINYYVEITESLFTLTDHLSIVETPAPDYYVSSPGETFQVYAQANIDPDQVRIGLFKTTGVFVEDITQSRSNHVYTCRISDHVASGNYMIQPCDIAADQTIRLIERKVGSKLIDKLPFAFVNGRSYQNNSVVTLSSHLVLNTSEKNLYKAYIDYDFRVVVNAPVTTYTRIGLFDVYGELVEDITQSVTGKIFTCKISYNVFPDNYMIMAYESSTPFYLIERNPGSAVMDKLPLAVDYDWSRRGVPPKLLEGQVESGIFENIQFYPNPVQDMLYIYSSGPIVSVCIYDLNGRLVKDAGEVDQVSLADLQAGTYVLKIQTQEREITGKVRKN